MAIASEYDVTHKCGHKQTHDLSSLPAGDRQGRARWLATTDCTSCFITKKKRSNTRQRNKERGDEVQVALPSRHPLAQGSAVALRRLADETWIAGCPQCRGHLLAIAGRDGFEPRIDYATDDYVAVLGLVAAGLGVALVPGLVLRTAHHHDVVMRPLAPTSRRAVVAVTTPDLARVPAVVATLSALRQAAAD